MQLKTQQLLTRVAVTLLGIFYLYSLYLQYSDLFFEAQFLHLNFIEDLANNTFKPQHFFTTYGEHLFPGYNILLFLNFKFFKVNALFELACSVIASFATFFLILKALKQDYNNCCLTIAIALVMFSPAQHVMSGMALAAHISTLLLVFIIYIIYFNEIRYKNYLLAILIPIYIVLFAGAYCVGFLASLISVFIFANYAKDKKLLITLAIFSLISYFLYYFLLSKYRMCTFNEIGHYSYNKLIISQFAIMMFAASALGKAFFETTGSYLIYYISGAFILAVTLISSLSTICKNKLNKLDYFFFALLAYALGNIAAVAVARNTNGVEGALGDWYQTHLQFLPVATLYFLSKLTSHNLWQKCLKVSAIAIMVLLVAIGYKAEYTKAPYIKDWKNNIKGSLADQLARPSYFLDNQHPNPMLWKAENVYQGLLFFYSHHLAYFRGSVAYSSPLTSDNWFEKKSMPFFSIVCPDDSNSLILTVDHINSDNIKLLTKTFKVIPADNHYQLYYTFSNKIKVMSFDTNEFTTFNTSNALDTRQLLFHVHSIKCSQKA